MGNAHPTGCDHLLSNLPDEIEQVIEERRYSRPTTVQGFLTRPSANLLADGEQLSNLVQIVTMVVPNRTISHGGIIPLEIQEAIERQTVGQIKEKLSPVVSL